MMSRVADVGMRFAKHSARLVQQRSVPMRLNHLSPAEMVSLSQPILDPKHPAHLALKVVPEAFALTGRLRAAHDTLVGRQLYEDARARALQQELLGLKSTHDELVRGFDSLLGACETLSEDPEVRVAWQRLHTQVLPDGLGVVNLSYSAAGGHALLLEKRMESVSASDKKLLKSQFVGRRNAANLVQRLIELGLLLGSKEQDRQSLLAGPNPAEIFGARQQWARTVGLMLSLIDMAPPNAEIEQHVRSPLRAASIRAGRRRRVEEPKPEPAPVLAPTLPAPPPVRTDNGG